MPTSCPRDGDLNTTKATGSRQWPRRGGLAPASQILDSVAPMVGRMFGRGRWSERRKARMPKQKEEKEEGGLAVEASCQGGEKGRGQHSLYPFGRTVDDMEDRGKHLQSRGKPRRESVNLLNRRGTTLATGGRLTRRGTAAQGLKGRDSDAVERTFDGSPPRGISRKMALLQKGRRKKRRLEIADAARVHGSYIRVWEQSANPTTTQREKQSVEGGSQEREERTVSSRTPAKGESYAFQIIREEGNCRPTICLKRGPPAMRRRRLLQAPAARRSEVVPVNS